ncbi:hypothetical protein [Labilibacter marinus]|uniref:hypothetical protein n=1 Tax=Labilibacter marinus TaxID=1477105 RepID=UPI0013011BC2|nr:hypothetical protein [Labilibacter marinus]
MSTRNYNYKDVDMLLASKTIAQALKEQFTFSKVVAQMGVSKKAAKENTEV